VVGSISPWNFPFILTMGDTIPALLAGNAVLLKPSSKTPLTAVWGRERFIEAGLPPDLFQVVTGPAGEIADALIANTDFIMFTGSTEVGRGIAVKAAQRLIPYSMELGGKNAMIVLPGSNIKHAAQVAVEGAFNNAGQVCISFERLYVHDKIYDVFKNELVSQTTALRLGSQQGFEIDLGSMIDEGQAKSVDAHVQDAVKKGAKVLAGGNFRPELGPAFYEPTILEGVTPKMDVFAEETFGPVLSLYRVGSPDEAIRLANDSRYGLHYGVYSGDLRQGERVAAQLQAGSVSVNDSYMSWGAMDGPMGGFKDSGVSRRHGPEGIRKYTEPQTILTNQTLWQIASYDSALSMHAKLARALNILLRIWRHVPFVR
jgi:succinate-semialdehyde dehydrogenase/glutarate-semialdehyde dehydrogenase